MGGSLLAFGLVALLVTVTPGPDTALVVRTTLRGGRRAGVDVALGVCSGLLVWALATVLGITVLLRASQTAYNVLRAAGAVWLVVLGVRTLIDARRGAQREAGDGDATTGTQTRPRRLASYRNGLLSNVLNPKIGVFYLTLLPQFVPAGAAVLPTTLLFASIQVVQVIAWLSAVAWLTSRARSVLGRGAWRRASERVTGTVLVVLGLRLALERR